MIFSNVPGIGMWNRLLSSCTSSGEITTLVQGTSCVFSSASEKRASIGDNDISIFATVAENGLSRDSWFVKVGQCLACLPYGQRAGPLLPPSW